MPPTLAFDSAQRAVWDLIEARRPLTIDQVAGALERTPSQLRRALRLQFGTNFRKLRARARVTYAIRAIERGDKIEAVLREVGLRNRTSFIKQCRLHTGRTPQSFLPLEKRRNGAQGG